MPKPKELPHDTEAEQAILGSILISRPAEQGQILDLLADEDFLAPAHKLVLTSLREMRELSTPADLVTLTNHLRNKGELDKVGGPAAVTHLFTMVPSASLSNHYMEIVKDKAMLRKLRERAEKTIKYCDGKGDFFSPDHILNHAKEEFSKIERWQLNPPKTIADHANAKLERMENGNPDELIVHTGIAQLDKISPLKKGDLPILKAKKKTGKSILAITILENICVTNKKPGLFFSLEDRTEKVVDRIFSGVARIPMDRDHVKKMTQDEMDRSMAAIAKISEANIIIYDDVFDLLPILARARKACADHKDLAIIVVDYAQLIRVEVKKSDTREREVATISRAFRLLAMETGVPILLISQVNNDGETRESRALEQDCTASWALIQEDEEEPTERLIRVEFQRNGESGVAFPVRFLGNIARVENASIEVGPTPRAKNIVPMQKRS